LICLSSTATFETEILVNMEFIREAIDMLIEYKVTVC